MIVHQDRDNDTLSLTSSLKRRLLAPAPTALSLYFSYCEKHFFSFFGYFDSITL